MKFEILKNIIEKPISGEWGIEGDGINVLRTTNFQNDGRLDLRNVVRRNISQNKIEQKRLRNGDIIIEKSGGSPNQPVGRVVYFDQKGDYLCNNFTSILRPKNGQVFSKYLHYLLFASHKYGVVNRFQNKTTGIINLQLERYIQKVKIPIPPLSTQQQIARILDQADDLRKKTQQVIDLYDQLAQSIFLDMFGDPERNPKGWERKKLSNIIARLGSGKSLNSVSKEHAGDYKVLKTSSVSWGFFNQLESKYLPKGYIAPKEHLVARGDILMSRMNTTQLVGASAYVHQEVTNLALPDRIWKFIWKNEEMVVPIFIWFTINKPSFRNEISKVSTGTSGSMKNISQTKLLALDIITPPITLQNQFAEKISLIEKQKELAKQSFQESENLFNALLQKAFKGELVNSV